MLVSCLDSQQTARPSSASQTNDSVFFRLAWPLADAALTQEILDLLQSATHIRQSKKGANEGMYTYLHLLRETQ